MAETVTQQEKKVLTYDDLFPHRRTYEEREQEKLARLQEFSTRSLLQSGFEEKILECDSDFEVRLEALSHLKFDNSHNPQSTINSGRYFSFLVEQIHTIMEAAGGEDLDKAKRGVELTDKKLRLDATAVKKLKEGLSILQERRR
jgi:hypothetical protein